jgi:hypothetical protein
MKQHDRRASGGFPYFKLATFDPISMCFRDGKQAYETAEKAYAAARKPGRYRLSVVDADGRTDLSEFAPTRGGVAVLPPTDSLGATYLR